jgi:uncharacterized membrane protein (DUF485 family)
LVLIAGMLYDLTAFRGEYLHNLTGSIEPQIPVAVAVVLLALTMTASLLLPFTSVGQATALGLLVSTFVRQRVYITLVQAAFIALRMVIIGGFLFGALQFRFDVLEASHFVVWLVLLGFAVTSDWGMSFLYLGYFGQQVWGDVPYGIFLGVGMIVMVFVQAIVTDLLLTLACRRAELSE